MATFNLDDLGEVFVTVDVVRPDGVTVGVPMRSISEQEIWQVRQSIKQPVAPMEPKKTADGKFEEVRITSGPLFDAYRAEQEKANRQQNYRLLLRCVAFPVEGNSDDERQKTLETKLGAYAFNQLLAHMLKMAGISEPEVVATAGSFQAN